MSADGFDYKIAAGLHGDRLREAESHRRARAARISSAPPVPADFEVENHPAREAGVAIRRSIGRQLIALGERMTA